MEMNEGELAQWFEKRRGDTSLWSEVPVKADVRRGGSVVFSVRFSAEELLLLRRRAEECGTTVSQLIRSAVLQAADLPSRVSTVTIDSELVSPPYPSAVHVASGYGSAASAPPFRPLAEPSVEYVVIQRA